MCRHKENGLPRRFAPRNDSMVLLRSIFWLPCVKGAVAERLRDCPLRCWLRIRKKSALVSVPAAQSLRLGLRRPTSLYTREAMEFKLTAPFLFSPAPDSTPATPQSLRDSSPKRGAKGTPVSGLSAFRAYAKGGKVLPFPPQAFLLALLNIDDRTALVLTAVLASTVRHAELAAVGALDDSGSGELPGRRTSLVTSLSRYFSFWDCHVDTS